MFHDVVDFYNNMEDKLSINSVNDTYGHTHSTVLITDLNFDQITPEKIKQALDSCPEGWGSRHLTVDYYEYDPSHTGPSEYSVTVENVTARGILLESIALND